MIYLYITFAFNEHLNLAEGQALPRLCVRYLDVFPLYRGTADIVDQSPFALEIDHVWQAQLLVRVVLLGRANSDADVLFPLRDEFELLMWKNRESCLP